MRATYLCVMGFAGVLLISSWLAAPALAMPTKRFDPRSGTCRVFDGQVGWDSEPWGLGGRKFREVCKSCHTRDNDKGAPFLHSESFMPKAWNRIFAKRRVPCARNGSWDSLTPEEIMSVNDYLYRFGDWTYDPNSAATCG